ncbi:MAG: dihydroneopterin aldolase [Gammaproteobacteria bacterium RIFCSPHIGHO2_02_FULL_39_13]|nr:MAG: dihydroneopterin aldolase [Gammaproteobacteria bacterium RIFCSPHIGHO2_02_FULL_39_13]OGT50583.1 MAG: dihydroneopterin aldolase [Gammaproteobacteria bacterium RIFCSPHIGHO2_12_FULL_39_24]
MSAKIIISNLVVHAVIGVHKQEQRIQQTLSIDFIYAVDIDRATRQDILADTQDYSAICHSIIDFVEKNPTRLLETLAKKLADHLQQQFQFSEFELSITKKPADMPFMDGVRVVLGSSRFAAGGIGI